MIFSVFMIIAIGNKIKKPNEPEQSDAVEVV